MNRSAILPINLVRSVEAMEQQEGTTLPELEAFLDHVSGAVAPGHGL